MGKKKAGILMPIASLPNRFGVGDFGPSTYAFVDRIHECGFKIWQLLPLNPLGYGNSPYQPYSSKALDDIYISLDFLEQLGLIKHVKSFNQNNSKINYDELRAYQQHYLRLAFENFTPNEKAQAFFSQPWVKRYAVFVTFKKANRLICWNDWPYDMENWVNNDKHFDLSPYTQDIAFEMFVQYILHEQWMDLKRYANNLGIEIMGDIPFYVGIDSDDVWANQKCFLLDKDRKPSFIAGVPPDYFSATGQRWGNPIYNWKYIAKHNYAFWIDRLSYTNSLFDIIRIDHFRAFDTYWKIPSSCETAQVGKWIEGPSYDFFDRLFNECRDLNIVAEDLGNLREEVLELRDHYQFKGMQIMEFVFDEHKGCKTKRNCIAYTGTHDNQTIRSWYMSLPKTKRENIRKFFVKQKYHEQSMAHNFVKYTFDTNAEYAIIPMQDLLNLTDKHRLNTPGTVGNPNWQFRIKNYKAFDEQIPHIKKMIKKAKR